MIFLWMTIIFATAAGAEGGVLSNSGSDNGQISGNSIINFYEGGQKLATVPVPQETLLSNTNSSGGNITNNQVINYYESEKHGYRKQYNDYPYSSSENFQTDPNGFPEFIQNSGNFNSSHALFSENVIKNFGDPAALSHFQSILANVNSSYGEISRNNVLNYNTKKSGNVTKSSQPIGAPVSKFIQNNGNLNSANASFVNNTIESNSKSLRELQNPYVNQFKSQ